LEYERAKLERDVAAAELRGDAKESARLKLEDAERRLNRVEELSRNGAASPLEVADAKLARDVAAAEVRGDHVAALRLRFEYADARVNAIEQLVQNGAASAFECEQARAARLLAKAELDAALQSPGSTPAAIHAQRLRTHSELRQIGQACYLYAIEHEGRMPQQLNELATGLHGITPGDYELVYAGKLGEASAGQLQVPQVIDGRSSRQVILVKTREPIAGTNLAVYADGHTGVVGEEGK
jgi:hypothetical protein